MADKTQPTELSDDDLDEVKGGGLSYTSIKPTTTETSLRRQGIRKTGIRVPGVRVPGIRVPSIRKGSS